MTMTDKELTALEWAYDLNVPGGHSLTSQTTKRDMSKVIAEVRRLITEQEVWVARANSLSGDEARLRAELAEAKAHPECGHHRDMARYVVENQRLSAELVQAKRLMADRVVWYHVELKAVTAKIAEAHKKAHKGAELATKLADAYLLYVETAGSALGRLAELTSNANAYRAWKDSR